MNVKSVIVAGMALVCSMQAFCMVVNCAIKRECIISGPGLRADARYDSCFLVSENAETTNAFAVVAVIIGSEAPERLVAYSWSSDGFNLARKSLADEKLVLREFEKSEERIPIAIDAGMFWVKASTNNVGVASFSVTSKEGYALTAPQILHKKICKMGDSSFMAELEGMRLTCSTYGRRPFSVAKGNSHESGDTMEPPTLSVGFYRDDIGRVGFRYRVLSSSGIILYNGESTVNTVELSGEVVALKCKRTSGEGELAVTMERKSHMVSGVSMVDLSLICKYGSCAYNIVFNISGLDDV